MLRKSLGTSADDDSGLSGAMAVSRRGICPCLNHIRDSLNKKDTSKLQASPESRSHGPDIIVEGIASFEFVSVLEPSQQGVIN